MNTIAISIKGGVGRDDRSRQPGYAVRQKGSKRGVPADRPRPQASATDYFGLYGEAESTGRNSHIASSTETPP